MIQIPHNEDLEGLHQQRILREKNTEAARKHTLVECVAAADSMPRYLT